MSAVVLSTNCSASMFIKIWCHSKYCLSNGHEFEPGFSCLLPRYMFTLFDASLFNNVSRTPRRLLINFNVTVFLDQAFAPGNLCSLINHCYLPNIADRLCTRRQFRI